MADLTPASHTQPVGPLSPFRERAFLATWTSGALSSSANWMLTLSVPVLVWELTESASMLGTAGMPWTVSRVGLIG